MVERCNHSWDKFYFLCGFHTLQSPRLNGLGGLEKLASVPLSTQIFLPLRVFSPSGLTENTLAYQGNHVEEWRVSLLMVPIGEDNIKNSLKWKEQFWVSKSLGRFMTCPFAKELMGLSTQPFHLTLAHLTHGFFSVFHPCPELLWCRLRLPLENMGKAHCTFSAVPFYLKCCSILRRVNRTFHNEKVKYKPFLLLSIL